MTAEEAIASIREDIDYLERKNLVKKGHILRKRAELVAIEQEREAIDGELMRAQMRIAQIEQEHELDRLRTGILANMLTVLGIPWERRIEMATEHEADVMERAAQIASENNRNTFDSNTPKWRLLESLRAATMAARIEIGMETMPLSTIPTNGKEEEERRAA